MAPALRRNIGLLIEGHVQYQFMTITEIEKFYAAFYPGQWKKEAYYELMNKLKVVVLPVPFFPNSPRIRPLGTVKLRFS